MHGIAASRNHNIGTQWCFLSINDVSAFLDPTKVDFRPNAESSYGRVYWAVRELYKNSRSSHEFHKYQWNLANSKLFIEVRSRPVAVLEKQYIIIIMEVELLEDHEDLMEDEKGWYRGEEQNFQPGEKAHEYTNTNTNTGW